MFGFRITRHDPNYQEQYAYLTFEIYCQDAYDKTRWERIGKWAYLSDNGRDYWYGGDLAQWHTAYSTAFESFVKFAQKVSKANMYMPTVDELLTWFDAQKVKRLSYDNRTGKTVLTSELEKTKELNCYKIIRRSDGRYLEDVLAYSEHDALRNLPEYSRNDRQAAEYGIKLEQKYDAIGLNELKSITELITR